MNEVSSVGIYQNAFLTKLTVALAHAGKSNRGKKNGPCWLVNNLLLQHARQPNMLISFL